jgi:hypothetical protein
LATHAVEEATSAMETIVSLLMLGARRIQALCTNGSGLPWFSYARTHR